MPLQRRGISPPVESRLVRERKVAKLIVLEALSRLRNFPAGLRSKISVAGLFGQSEGKRPQRAARHFDEGVKRAASPVLREAGNRIPRLFLDRLRLRLVVAASTR
jgi:hypothetical protein